MQHDAALRLCLGYEAIKAALFIQGKKGNVEFHRGNMTEALRESNRGKRNGGIKEIDSY